ncbi:hypothetical protein ACOSQ3_031543 [Xanthoceras sorbifolium]
MEDNSDLIHQNHHDEASSSITIIVQIRYSFLLSREDRPRCDRGFLSDPRYSKIAYVWDLCTERVVKQDASQEFLCSICNCCPMCRFVFA